MEAVLTTPSLSRNSIGWGGAGPRTLVTSPACAGHRNAGIFAPILGYSIGNRNQPLSAGMRSGL
jgi:hypothetical protein